MAGFNRSRDVIEEKKDAVDIPSAAYSDISGTIGSKNKVDYKTVSVLNHQKKNSFNPTEESLMGATESTVQQQMADAHIVAKGSNAAESMSSMKMHGPITEINEEHE